MSVVLNQFRAVYCHSNGKRQIAGWFQNIQFKLSRYFNGKFHLSQITAVLYPPPPGILKDNAVSTAVQLAPHPCALKLIAAISPVPYYIF